MVLKVTKAARLTRLAIERHVTVEQEFVASSLDVAKVTERHSYAIALLSCWGLRFFSYKGHLCKVH
jgi:hypothetical protein